VAIDGLNEDIAGRPCKQKLDIGCEELDGGAAARHPLTSNDVGPSWINGDYTALQKRALIEELGEAIRRYPDPGFRRELKNMLEKVNPRRVFHNSRPSRPAPADAGERTEP